MYLQKHVIQSVTIYSKFQGAVLKKHLISAKNYLLCLTLRQAFSENMPYLAIHSHYMHY